MGYESNQFNRAEPMAWIDGTAVRLSMPEWSNSATAEGANASGTIVGNARSISETWAFTREAGVIWIGAEAVELDSLVVGCDMRVVQARAVNEKGQIAANLVDSEGIWHAAVLEPAGADLNGDGQATPADFSAWLGLAATDDRRADLDADGIVGQGDLALLIALMNQPSTQDETGAGDESRTRQLSTAFLLEGVYDIEHSFNADDVAFHAIQPGNSEWHNWIKDGNQNKYHPNFNPNCYGCSGDDPNNPHAPDGAPGWPGNDPKNPYKPNGGPGGPGADGNPAGDGGDGGDGAHGNLPALPGNGGPGGSGGNNTDDGSGGDGGSGGSDGTP